MYIFGTSTVWEVLEYQLVYSKFVKPSLGKLIEIITIQNLEIQLWTNSDV